MIKYSDQQLTVIRHELEDSMDERQMVLFHQIMDEIVGRYLDLTERFIASNEKTKKVLEDLAELTKLS